MSFHSLYSVVYNVLDKFFEVIIINVQRLFSFVPYEILVLLFMYMFNRWFLNYWQENIESITALMVVAMCPKALKYITVENPFEKKINKNRSQKT